MKNNISISVVIPHYNIPELLVRALRSIPQRDDVQVVVVDDGSPEADKYIERYLELSASNVEFYPQSHCGLAGCMRNIGVEHAKGKWLTFLDADDFFVADADRIFSEVQQYNEDVVFYNSKAVMSDDITKESCRGVYSCIFDDEQCRVDERYFRYAFHSLWGKFIRRKVVEGYHIRFEDTPYGNDVYFSISVGVFAESIRVKKEVLYVVTERSGSITTKTKNASEKRFKECQVRYGVAYRSYKLLQDNKINVPLEMNPLFQAIGMFRSSYKKEYYKKLLSLVFVSPACAWHYVKKDFNYIFLGVRNPSAKM